MCLCKTIESNAQEVIYILGVLKHCTPWGVLGLGVLKHFGLKNQTRKMYTLYKDELYQVFMHNFLYQNVSIILLHIFLTRKINTFWSGGISTFEAQNSQRVFELYQVFICQTILIFFNK